MAERKKKVDTTEKKVETPVVEKKEETKDFETPIRPLRRLTREEKMAWLIGK